MVYRRVAAPEGLRRLTSTDKFRARRRSKLASSKLASSSNPAETEAMSRFETMDLEGGRRDGDFYSSRQDSRGLASGVFGTARRMLCLLRSWRWWAATVMALQAATIVVLIVRPHNDHKDGVAVTTDRWATLERLCTPHMFARVRIICQNTNVLFGEEIYILEHSRFETSRNRSQTLTFTCTRLANGLRRLLTGVHLFLACSRCRDLYLAGAPLCWEPGAVTRSSNKGDTLSYRHYYSSTDLAPPKKAADGL